MATPITIIVLAIVLTSQALGASEYGCQRNDVCDNISTDPIVKPNPDDCGSFCICSCGGFFLMNCPDGQEFDPINKQCDWPSKAHCTLRPKPPPPGNNGCEKQQYLCPDIENGHTVLLPNPDNCTSFCQCDWGNIHWIPCPNGLYFNPTNQVCDWPRNVDCIMTTEAPPTPPPTITTTSKPAPTENPGSCEKVRPDCPEMNGENATLLPNPDDCGSYCVCDWGRPIWMPCPEGLYFNPHLKVCDWKWRADCPPGSASVPPPPPTEVNPPDTTSAPGSCEKVRPDCPEMNGENATLLPNPDDCGSYCVCDWGRPIWMPCPEGLYFNPHLKVCDWKWRADCPPGSASVPPPPPTEVNPPDTTSAPGSCEKVRPDCPEMNGENATLLPNPDDCGSYCVCDWGRPIWMPCPEGLYFNPHLKVCDWKWRADCPPGSASVPPPPPTEVNPPDTTSAPGSCEKVRPDCPEMNGENATLLPNPDDCGSYCVCDWGRPIWMPCPEGLYFNPHLKVCDWKWRADCPPGSASVPPPPPTEVNPPDTTSAPGSCEKVRPDCPEMNGENATLLPNPDDCGSYCVCDWGKPIWMPCPEGLYFNPHLKVCDWKWRADCPPGSASVPPPPPTEVNPPDTTSAPGSCEKVRPDCPEMNGENATLLPNPDDCGSYCVCDWGRPIWMPCPEGLYFNPHLKVCDWKWRADCPPGSASVPPPPPTEVNPPDTTSAPGSCEKVRPDCPEMNGENATLLPNPDDCGSYCVCDWGIPIWMPCPEGLYFNPHLKVCDWKWRADCPPGSASVPPPPPTEVNPPDTTSAPGSCEKVRPDCPEMNGENATLLPNPDDCGSYCVCDWGRPIWMPCPEGLYFNPHLKVCDWPYRADCPPGSASVPPPPPPTGVVPPTGDCDGVSLKCPKIEVGNATLLPNPNDCKSYCACSWGTAIWMPCPAELQFNPILSVCDWPKNANCGATTDSQPVPPSGKDGCHLVVNKCPVPQPKKEFLLSNPWDKRSFCQCNWGRIHYMPCASATIFDEKLQDCV